MRRTILAAVAAAVVLSGCAVATPEDLAKADYGPYPTNYEAVVRSYMNRTLKDPESARYEFLNSPKQSWNGIGGLKFGYSVCVNINAKNSYGGYVGTRMSYFMIKDGRVIDSSHGDGKYGDAMVEGRCKHFI